MAVNLKPVNRRALRRYGEFWRALQMVGDALADAERLAAKSADRHSATPRAVTGTGHWASATPEELTAAARKAGDALHVIATAARTWEAELVSREWRR